MWTCKLFNSLEAVNAGPVRGVFLMPGEISLVDIIHCAIDIEVQNSVIYHWTYFGDWFFSEVKLGHNHFELFHLDTSLYKYTCICDVLHFSGIDGTFTFKYFIYFGSWWNCCCCTEQVGSSLWSYTSLWILIQECCMFRTIISVLSFNLFIECRMVWE